MQIPTYIADRIRAPVPLDSSVVPGSTPVVSFGNAQTATVATLGLNPSRVEFLDRRGNELVGPERRLATRRSLGTNDWSTAPAGAVSEVLEDCYGYFHRNPYRRWFDQLEPILGCCGASYYDESACHLDLVQWATDPTWGRLTGTVRRQLLSADAPFLQAQLQNESIQLLLVNGAGVLRQLEATNSAGLQQVDTIPGLGYQDTRLFEGKLFGRIRVIGWSTNVQSSFGVTHELRHTLAARVGIIAENAEK